MKTKPEPQDLRITAGELAAAVKKRTRLITDGAIKPSASILAKNSAECGMLLVQPDGKPPKSCGKPAIWQDTEPFECDFGGTHKKVKAVWCDMCHLWRVHTGQYDGPQTQLDLGATDKAAPDPPAPDPDRRRRRAAAARRRHRSDEVESGPLSRAEPSEQLGRL